MNIKKTKEELMEDENENTSLCACANIYIDCAWVLDDSTNRKTEKENERKRRY